MRKLLFFHAPWCSPCRRYVKEYIEPLEQLAGEDKVVRVNAQDAPQTAEKYGIDKIPTVVILDGAAVVWKGSEKINVETVAAWLKGE